MRESLVIASREFSLQQCIMPTFDLSRGEVWTLYLPVGSTEAHADLLCHLLDGTVVREEMVIRENAEVVRPNDSEFLGLRVNDQLRMVGLPPDLVPALNGRFPKGLEGVTLHELPLTLRLRIGLSMACSKSRIAVVPLGGLDPMGVQSLMADAKSKAALGCTVLFLQPPLYDVHRKVEVGSAHSVMERNWAIDENPGENPGHTSITDPTL